MHESYFTKKKEAGKNFLNVNYNVNLVVTTLTIKLFFEDTIEDLNISYQLRSAKTYELFDSCDGNLEETDFQLNKFGEYYIKVIIKKDNSKYTFNTEVVECSYQIAIESLSGLLEKEISKEEITSFKEALNKKFNIPSIGDKINAMVDEINVAHTLGFGLDDYLVDEGYINFSIYTEKQNYLLLSAILTRLHESKRVRIHGYYNRDGEHYKISDQREMRFQPFQKFSIEDYSPEIPLLLVMQEIPERLLKKFVKKGISYISLPEILPQFLRYASFSKPLELFKKKHTGLTVLLHNHPRIPNLKNASDDERQILKKGVSGLRKGLRENPPELKSASLAQFNYEIDKIYPFLTGWEQLTLDSNGVVSGKDYSSKYVNFVAGHRVTVDQPLEYERTVWHFGYSHVWGNGSPDYGTISSHLQSAFSREKMNVRVENYGYSGITRNISAVMKKINSMSSHYKDGDIILIEKRGKIQKTDDFFLDIRSLFKRPHNFGEVYVDTHHLNERGNEVVANKIFNYIKEQGLLELSPGTELTINNEGFDKAKSNFLQPSEQVALNHYLNELELLRPQIGSIVMNCNPFTLGHRYLIEQSAAKCTQLFIFVVEEDLSYFPFADRIELVSKGTADLPNVKVIPSGKFIISNITFSDYFGKAQMQDQTIDPSMDVELFGKYIAPKLGISIRFVGEEPLDHITQQYNDAMQRILPQHNVDFEVIPRKESGGAVISASRVRALLEEKDFDAIKKIVPITTFSYLVDKFK